jgi:hypothetical protein
MTLKVYASIYVDRLIDYFISSALPISGVCAPRLSGDDSELGLVKDAGE